MKLGFDEYIGGGTQKDFYNENEIEECPCPICDSEEFNLIDKERGLSISQCSSCGHLYTNPRAKNSEENYFGDASHFFNEAKLIFSGKKSHHRDKNYEYELRKIKKYKASGKLLDIGTNMGFFLRKASDYGYNVEGVEPSPSLSEIARKQFGLKIHTAFVEQADLQPNDYDLITLIDVLEHVKDPKGILRKCFDLLKQDGILVIKVPNGNYVHLKMRLAKLLKKREGLDIWDCFEHVSHYKPNTFKRLVTNEGFEIIETFIPLPIHSPVWADHVGHYYQYPSPFILDWKRITLRNLFYWTGRLEKALGLNSRFGPDLMFVLKKHEEK